MNKFLIFASPRTGSTTLVNLVGSMYFREERVLHTHIAEPFWRPNLIEWYKNILPLCSSTIQKIYAKGPSNESLTKSQTIEVLNVCYNNSCGIKHLHTHLPHAQNVCLLEYAMSRGYKIIFLTRDSHVLKDISTQLAEQSGAWTLADMKRTEYGPINIEILKEKVHWNLKYKKNFGEIMSDYDVYNISYEEIYCKNNQLEEVYKIMDYLEIDKDKLRMNKFHEKMNYDKNKQHTPELYSKIPNINEVIQFAEDEYGEDISYINTNNEHASRINN